MLSGVTVGSVKLFTFLYSNSSEQLLQPHDLKFTTRRLAIADQRLILVQPPHRLFVFPRRKQRLNMQRPYPQAADARTRVAEQLEYLVAKSQRFRVVAFSEMHVRKTATAFRPRVQQTQSLSRVVILVSFLKRFVKTSES